MKLFLDLDDVVLDTSKCIREIGDYLNLHKEEFFITKENFHDALSTYLLTNYHKVRVKQDFIDVFPLLQEKFDIVFVSFYISEAELAYKRSLARKYGCGGVFLKHTEHKDKSSVDMSGGIFVDDTIEMLTSSNADKKFHFCSPKKFILYKALKSADTGVTYSWENLANQLGVLS